MDELDRALWGAWERARGLPVGEKVRRLRVGMRSTYARPLRAWSLVLRADDRRIEAETAGEGEEGSECGMLNAECGGGKTQETQEAQETQETQKAREAREVRCGEWVLLDGGSVRRLCGDVEIRPPGVGAGEAAELLGVNEKTVRAWGRGVKMQETQETHETQEIGGGRGARGFGGGVDGRTVVGRDWWVVGERPPFGWGRMQREVGRLLVRDRYVNEADRKRDRVLYWTERPIDPGGEVWTAQWGAARRGLTKLVALDWSQWIRRRRAAVHGHLAIWKWVCPACGVEARKLFWPMPVWTVAAMFDEGLAAACRAPVGDGFRCRRCAGLIYESAERHKDAWDRFVKRISAGALRGGEVEG